MEFNISTPALLFSAISLLMLAYTNRFLALSNLIRQLIPVYKNNPEENILKQIRNFKTRLGIIKYTQVLGVLSFIFCVVCMLLIILEFHVISEFLFMISLLLLMLSLILSLYEIFISIGALKFELEKIENIHGGEQLKDER
ncbi:MAG: DUF2721 domain-containing protein [Spirochaetes bacterium]|nr:DUF2721 domain-containing protein [Spirochaetota bacterium]